MQTGTSQLSLPGASRLSVQGCVHGVVIFDLERALLAEPAWLGQGSSGGGVAPMHEAHRREVAARRVKAARALRIQGVASLEAQFARARLVPDAANAVGLLQQRGVICGVASLGWDIAAEVVARRLGIRHHFGVGVEPGGAVVHVWQEDEAEYPRRLAAELSVPVERSLLVRERVPLLRFARALLRSWR
jgi:phosphoserine phosphatase